MNFLFRSRKGRSKQTKGCLFSFVINFRPVAVSSDLCRTTTFVISSLSQHIPMPIACISILHVLFRFFFCIFYLYLSVLVTYLKILSGRLKKFRSALFFKMRNETRYDNVIVVVVVVVVVITD